MAQPRISSTSAGEGASTVPNLRMGKEQARAHPLSPLRFCSPSACGAASGSCRAGAGRTSRRTSPRRMCAERDGKSFCMIYSDRVYHAKTDVRSARANSNTRPKFSTTQASIMERSPADPGSWAWLQRSRCCRREQLRAGAVQPRCWDSGRPVAERTPAGRCCRFAARASPTHAPASPRSTFYRRSTRDP